MMEPAKKNLDQWRFECHLQRRHHQRCARKAVAVDDRAEKAAAVDDSDDDGASTAASTVAVAPLPGPTAHAKAASRKAGANVSGRVKVFFEEKDYGFIALESGNDVFFHRKSLDAGVSVERNDTVEVNISEDRSGKVRVNHVDLIKKATSKVCGRVKVFFEEKDYGFIALESGNEVFFHRTSLDVGLSVGRNDIVEVIISEDRSGKARVNHVDLIKKATLMRRMCINPKCKANQHFEDRCPLGVCVPAS
jgi:cold shock CspA family protein